MGRERSARVSAVGRSKNLALDALQDAAVTRCLVYNAQIIAQKQVPDARPAGLSAPFFAPHARCLQVCRRLLDGIATTLCLLLDCLDGITGLLVVDP